MSDQFAYEPFVDGARKFVYNLYPDIVGDLSPEDLYIILGRTRWGAIKGTVAAQFYDEYYLYYKGE